MSVGGAGGSVSYCLTYVSPVSPLTNENITELTGEWIVDTILMMPGLSLSAVYTKYLSNKKCQYQKINKLKIPAILGGDKF